MKYISIFFLIFLPFFSSAQNVEKSKDKELILKYYKAYNSKDYKTISEVIDNGVLVYEDGYLILNSKIKFIDIVKWGEVFKSKNKLEKVASRDGVWICTEVQKSERIRFLYGNDVKAQTQITIKNNRIIKIESYVLDFNPNLDFNMYRKFRDWVKENHTELYAKAFELDAEGAEAFKQAMKKYNKKSSK